MTVPHIFVFSTGSAIDGIDTTCLCHWPSNVYLVGSVSDLEWCINTCRDLMIQCGHKS